ncbi:MAG: hypothetical protein J5855_05915 [Mailhella sp.]|nr:hypothetical protein [Mailhella sp.]
MNPHIKTVLLPLAVLFCTASLASAENLFGPGETIAEKQPAQTTAQPHEGGSAVIPPYEAPKLAAQNRPAQTARPLHGNTDSKVFHAWDCFHYKCTACTAVFNSAHDAEMAGYHACRVCEGTDGVATAKRESIAEQAKKYENNICTVCGGN